MTLVFENKINSHSQLNKDGEKVAVLAHLFGFTNNFPSEAEKKSIRTHIKLVQRNGLQCFTVDVCDLVSMLVLRVFRYPSPPLCCG